MAEDKKLNLEELDSVVGGMGYPEDRKAICPLCDTEFVVNLVDGKIPNSIVCPGCNTDLVNRKMFDCYLRASRNRSSFCLSG